MSRIGLFGGTFDPIHVGHLVTAVNVRHELSLDEVLLVVANDPWQKSGHQLVTPALDRLAMVTAAIADVKGISASDAEIVRGGASYTADTLRQLHAERTDDELFLILGSDAAAGIPTWEGWEEVRELSTLVVVTRPGFEGSAAPDGWPCLQVEVPRLEVSSTDLRARFADGRPLDWLVTEPVVRLIRERGLYDPRR